MALNSLLFIPLLLIIRFLATNFLSQRRVAAVTFNNNQWTPRAKLLTNEEFSFLSQWNEADGVEFNRTLDHILIERVPGTEGHARVRNFIESEMNALQWNVSRDSFWASTPIGRSIEFHNIIATLDPSACSRLVFACHYDSKLMKNFVGATDSAVPCAMMIHMMKSLNPFLKKLQSETTLQLIFFDGEEAFVNWNEHDSIYGSRHLANLWNRQKLNFEEKSKCSYLSEFESQLDRIQVLILLDLIGSKNPQFYSYFSNTNSLHSRLIQIEKKLNELNPNYYANYFKNRRGLGLIEDDHIPFLQKGVPILHVIPSPFPSVWHKISDNKENIHHPSIIHLIKVFKIFVAQYLHLSIT